MSATTRLSSFMLGGCAFEELPCIRGPRCGIVSAKELKISMSLQRALYLHNRALYLCKKALYLQKSPVSPPKSHFQLVVL